jgi:hypothetical protein
VPVIVTGVPPPNVPAAGAIDVTVTGGRGVTLTFVDCELLHPADVVTVIASVIVPGGPAVNVMLAVPLPPVIAPPVMLHAYVAPAPALATDALPAARVLIDAAVVIAAFGGGLIVTVVAEEAGLVQPFVVTVTL